MAKQAGTWLDTKANKLVTSQPEEGIQLIAPGIEATPDELAAVEAVKASLSAGSAPSTEPAPAPAETADMPPVSTPVTGTTKR